MRIGSFKPKKKNKATLMCVQSWNLRFVVKLKQILKLSLASEILQCIDVES